MMLSITNKSEWIRNHSKYICILLANCGYDSNNLYKNSISDEIYDCIHIHLSNHLNDTEILDKKTLNAISLIIDDIQEIFNIDKNKYNKLYSLYESVLED